MVGLILGPLLRHVGARDATIWVETAGPCTVEVRAGPIHATAKTFQVARHHYAVVVVEGLEPGSTNAYEVFLDGEPVWPPFDDTRPPSVIRTLRPEGLARLAFGSCREPADEGTHHGLDPDVLEMFAAELAAGHADPPDALLLLGDQVYADDTSGELQRFIRRRRDASRPPGTEVADFEEYTRLYQEAWSQPAIRWLFSTVPVSMIFDDHDIRDDWNTSRSWRDDMAAKPWWEERITSGLMAYWIYQHLGNLSPDGLARSEILAKVRAADDAEDVLRAFARHADAEADGAKGTMWSYRRDLGRVRLVVIDSRCGRILNGPHRAMISAAELDWIRDQIDDGDYDHLVIGTSMPWLLPRALHDIESWDEVLADPRRGRIVSTLGEQLRRHADLEHWAAFRRSFDDLASLLGRIGRGEHGGAPPATIAVLSGDVHHTYVAETVYPRATASRIVQITCSPFHNTIPRAMMLVFHVGWSRTVEIVMKAISRLSGVPPLPIHWRHPIGPLFGNVLAFLTFDGRSARVTLEKASAEGDSATGARRLETLAEHDLTGSPRPTH